MKPMRIDFSGRSPLRTLPSGSPRDFAMLGVLLLALLAVVAGVATWSHLQARTSAARQSLAEVEDQQVRLAQAPGDAGLSAEGIAAVNLAVRHLNYPWGMVFDALEKSLQPDVVISSVEVGMARQGAKIIIDAPTVEHALNYVEGLRGQPEVGGVVLMRQEVVSTDANLLRFTLDVQSSDVVRREGAPGVRP
ncbi:hypothetical protein [Uliginosibacterium sp. H1]|uniref:hypothetical protein n=1 Tax=Uliginosibacterium sp. H1 TaxID=3114757 RepID=UPI002E19A9C1|nr:hypothetical protein [Uliginosibacterium sp. H1]